MADTIQDNSKRTREIKGVVCLAVALFLLLCLMSYSPHDPSFTKVVTDGSSTHNLTGKFGSYTADSIIRLLGLPVFLLPLALLACAFQYFLRPAFVMTVQRILGFSFFMLALTGLLGALIKSGVTVNGEILRAGGLIGAGIVGLLLRYFNPAGTYIILLCILMVSLFFTIEFSLVSVTEKFSKRMRDGWASVKNTAATSYGNLSARLKTESIPPPVIEEDEVKPRKTKPKKIEQTRFDFSKLKPDGTFQLPPFTLLTEAPQKDGRVKRDQLVTNSRILERKLSDFGVEARVVDVMPGPVITMYELEPAPGVKINRITTLADDLAWP
jgi:S-DNA-T family DNA segregation ATPase FtsK/SpoIIIE